MKSQKSHKRRPPKPRKVCTKCKEIKPLTAFYASSRYHCKECVKAQSRERYHGSLKANITTRLHARLRATLPPGTPLHPLFDGVLPYSFDDLLIRLRSRIPERYTFDDLFNGTLQIDHCRPIASFDYQGVDDIEFRRCWALNNIIVTTTERNLRKGSHFNGVRYRDDG